MDSLRKSGLNIRAAAGLAAIIACGLAIRAPGLHARSLWFDEAFSWRLSTFSAIEIVVRTARDNNPPLFYLLLKGWTAVWGESAVALRGLSVLFAVATFAAVWLFAREAFQGNGGRAEGEGPAQGRRRPADGLGLLAAALVAASVLHVRWTSEARMYTLGTALAALSSWALLRALRGDRLRPWFLYAALALAFAYTHTYAPFTLASQGVFVAGWLLVGAWKERRARRREREAAASSEAAAAGSAVEAPTPRTPAISVTFQNALLAAVLVVAGFSPWLPILFRQRAQVQYDFWAPELSWRYVSDAFFAVWVTPLDAANTPAEAAAATAFTAALLLALLWRARAGEWLTLCLAAGPVLLALAVSQWDTRIFAAQYLIFAHTFMLVALARLIYRVPYRLERGLLAAVVLGSMVWIVADWRWRQDIPKKPGGRAASARIDAARRPGEPVVVCSPLLYFSVLCHSDHRDGWRLFDDGVQPRIRGFGSAAIRAEDLIDEEQLAATAAGRVWVVNMQGGGWGQHQVAVPKHWQVAGTHRYPEVYRMQGEVVVVEYLTHSPAAMSPP